MTIATFIKSKPYLLWYVKDKSKVSPEAVVEAVLNYGDWPDVQKLIKILGLRNVARIFNQQQHLSSGRTNYSQKTSHFFNLYFNKYAP
ncbi:MAG: hypothetical protein AAB963_00745 [Patescibacteria group bacterium]